jgi:hypothetical protein
MMLILIIKKKCGGKLLIIMIVRALMRMRMLDGRNSSLRRYRTKNRIKLMMRARRVGASLNKRILRMTLLSKIQFR